MGIKELREKLHAIIDQADERFLRMVHAMTIEYYKDDGDRKELSIVEKRDYIHSHLHLLSESALNEIYEKTTSLVKE